MTSKQKQILENAVKTKLKNETVLTGGNEYINPKRKLATKKKKKSFFEKLFG